MARVRKEELQHYERLIQQLLPPSSPPVLETPQHRAILVDRGMVFVRCIRGQEGIDLSGLIDAPSPAGTVAVLDSAGHTRPAYLGLLVYCLARAFGLSRASSPEVNDPVRKSVRAWCEVVEAEALEFDWPVGGLRAARGAEASKAAWCALALYASGTVLGQRRWIETGANVLGQFAAGQRGSGAFLVAAAGDNPETLWYHELVLLHAAASYAAQANDPLVTAAVMQAADFHVRETQPDHATTQPWGLLAFVWRREARNLADGMLHALKLRQPNGLDAVSSMLLADCLYCLRLLAR